MLDRDRFITFGFALALFVTGALVALDVPYWVIGTIGVAVAVVMIARVQYSEEWVIADAGMAFWIFLVGLTTIWTPAWGVPLLFVTAGVELVRALDDVGIAIDLALVAAVAYYSDAPLWTVVLLLLVAVGKVLWLLRDYDGQGNPAEALVS